MNDDTLLSLSGHTNVSTLRRYLSWGTVDRAKEVTMTRAAALAQAQGAPVDRPPPPPYTPLPTYADHLIRGGRPPLATTSPPYRRPRQPRDNRAPSGKTPERWLAFLGTEAPPTEVLPSTRHANRPAPETLPLMAKHVSASINPAAVLNLITDPNLKTLANSAFSWLSQPERYEDLLAEKRRAESADDGVALLAIEEMDRRCCGETIIDKWFGDMATPWWDFGPFRDTKCAAPCCYFVVCFFVFS